MLFIILALFLYTSYGNPHDHYLAGQRDKVGQSDDYRKSDSLLRYLVESGEICSDRDTYISTFRFPELFSLDLVVKQWQLDGWRITLEEIPVYSRNEPTSKKNGCGTPVCMMYTHFSPVGSPSCLKTIMFDKRIENGLWYEVILNTQICPDRIQVIHFSL